MSDIQTQILDAAVQVFMRYGVGRTRMGDIANEAGVVRQTLYSFFRSKDEILSASILHVGARSLADMRAAWDGATSLGDKIDSYYALSILPSFAIISASADARDMIGGFNAAGRAATRTSQQDKIDAWAHELAAHVSDRADMPPDAVAEFLVLGSLGLRDLATSEEQLRSLLDVQKRAVLAAVAG